MSLGGSLVRSYTWGPDLSGSLQGAGGIGGLVFVRQSGSSYYPTYDGNGNLTAMIRASDKSVVASYDYSPYGELLASSGSYASTNPFRFSTKYTDPETSLAYFGYRYYHPEMGRWLNRDLIEDVWVINLYSYVGNEPLNYIDIYGLERIRTSPKPSPKFQPPTNPPQIPPSPENLPPGWWLREMPPTQQYPNGYWKIEMPNPDYPNGRPIAVDPSTMKPSGSKPATHVEYPKPGLSPEIPRITPEPIPIPTPEPVPAPSPWWKIPFRFFPPVGPIIPRFILEPLLPPDPRCPPQA